MTNTFHFHFPLYMGIQLVPFLLGEVQRLLSCLYQPHFLCEDMDILSNEAPFSLGFISSSRLPDCDHCSNFPS